MGHPHFSEHSRGGRGRTQGRHRARRGAVRLAVLTLLAERPMHGYELITELESRSEGRWRPSPGAMYPALARLEEHGLVTSTDIDGKRQFSLTDDGRKRLTQLQDEQPDDASPWDDSGTGGRGDLRRGIAELAGQARQIGRFGTSAQIERAVGVFATAKRELYAVLAESPEGSDPGADRDEDEDAPEA